jgi:cytochrome c-type biogenesis protein CcmE
MTDLSPRPVSDATPRGRPQRRWLPMVVIGLVLVAGGVIVTQFLRSAVDYYCNADEIGVRSGCDADRRLRVQGIVDAGSVSEVNGDTAFTITFNDVTLPVRYDGQPGGIFKECMPVIVHGRLEGATFMGDDVEVKHDSSYQAANPERIAEAEADAAVCPADGG